MEEAVIISAARTPIARASGSLRDVPPEDLGALTIKEAVRRSNLPDPALIDEVIFGNCFAAGVGCLARMSSLMAGLPISVPGIQIDRQCGSGSTAVNLAAGMIQAGAADVYVAGGVESLTRQPFVLEKPTTAYQRLAPNILGPAWRLSPDEIGDPPMGIIAENMAERWKVSREEQDEFACLSQQKAARAIKEGRFTEQIVPVTIPQKKGDPVVFDTDEHPRPGTTMEQLAKLPPAFKAGGSVTAGNSSGINDGAGALVLASRTKARELGLKPLMTVKAFSSAGVDPNYMGYGPVPATQKALAKAGLTLGEMDVIEFNEAFASQTIACCQDLGLDWRDRDQERLNPNGGAIALGHPIAGSLAILVIKAVYELLRQNGQHALITACCGGGQGVATIIERCD